MKILKISVIISILVSSPFLFLIYDLASFDKSYLNRNVIYFNKTNLNSKKSKEFYSLIEKIYYKTIYKFSNNQKEYWGVDDQNRSLLDEYKIIKGQKSGFKKGLTLDEIKIPEKNWLRSHGNLNSIRFSNLKKINSQNIKNLKLAWTFSAEDGKKGIQANPIAKNGRVYFPTPGNFIVCLDGTNGKLIWKYKVKNGSHAAKRGLMLWKDKISGQEKIIFNNDDELIMLDADTGRLQKILEIMELFQQVPLYDTSN